MKVAIIAFTMQTLQSLFSDLVKLTLYQAGRDLWPAAYFDPK